MGIFMFVRAAKNCGFWEHVLVTTASEFGRGAVENTRKLRFGRGAVENTRIS